jgi:hypothetical protein
MHKNREENEGKKLKKEELYGRIISDSLVGSRGRMQ